MTAAHPEAQAKKVCVRCRVPKLLTEFPLDPARKDGRYSYCKPCKSEYMSTRYLSNREAIAEYDYRLRIQRYGITVEEYDALLLVQKGKCAICGSADGKNGGGKILNRHRLSIDHNHETGVVRGLLCGPCNRAVGLLQDNPEFCLIAASYLLKGLTTVSSSCSVVVEATTGNPIPHTQGASE